jgi:hypothetical protein
LAAIIAPLISSIKFTTTKSQLWTLNICVGSTISRLKENCQKEGFHILPVLLPLKCTSLEASPTQSADNRMSQSRVFTFPNSNSFVIKKKSQRYVEDQPLRSWQAGLERAYSKRKAPGTPPRAFDERDFAFFDNIWGSNGQARLLERCVRIWHGKGGMVHNWLSKGFTRWFMGRCRDHGTITQRRWYTTIT